jgi:hypothetical protein
MTRVSYTVIIHYTPECVIREFACMSALSQTLKSFRRGTDRLISEH